MMLRQITVRARAPTIAPAMGVAELAIARQARRKTTVLAALTTLALTAPLGACSEDKKPQNPKIADAAPRTGAAPTAPLPSTPVPPTPAISSEESKRISESYFSESKEAKSSHSISALEEIESGALLAASRARQERILKYGDNIASSEDKAANDQIKTITPQGTPNGEDRWILTVGRQTLSGKSRSSIGVLRQKKGAGNWKMEFLAYTPAGKKLPDATKIATKDGDVLSGESNIEYGDNICQSFAGYMNDASEPKGAWGPQAKLTRDATERERESAESLTKGGKVTVKTEFQTSDHIPSWSTNSGDKLILCTIKTTSELKSGPSPITISTSQTFQNLNGRKTKWNSLNLTTTGMVVLRVPASEADDIDIVADSYRALSSDGSPA